MIGTGRSSNAKTYLAMNKSSGELFVAKEISAGDLTAEDTREDKVSQTRHENIARLIDVISRLDHTNIVRYLGYQHVDTTYTIFSEYLSGGSLGELLRTYGKLEVPLVRSFAKQILEGLSYLHEAGVLHRDIRADKVFLDSKGTCKLGWSFTMTTVGDPNIPEAGPSGLESRYWQAPEVVSTEGRNYTSKADIWNAGLLVQDLLGRRRPFSKEEVNEAIYNLNQPDASPIPSYLMQELEPEALAFLFDCFCADPRDRPTAAALLQTPFLLPEARSMSTGSLSYNKIEAGLPYEGSGKSLG